MGSSFQCLFSSDGAVLEALGSLGGRDQTVGVDTQARPSKVITQPLVQFLP